MARHHCRVHVAFERMATQRPLLTSDTDVDADADAAFPKSKGATANVELSIAGWKFQKTL